MKTNMEDRLHDLEAENIKLIDLLRRWSELENIIGVTILYRETKNFMQSRMQTKVNLEAAKALIDRPQKWRREWGFSSKGSRFSLYDAVYDATKVSPHSTAEFCALGIAANGYHSVDSLLAFERDHTHKDLMKVFDKAIETLGYRK